MKKSKYVVEKVVIENEKELKEVEGNKKIKRIRIEGFFDKEIEKLPEGIKSIMFGWDFDQTIDKLPESIERIEFGDCFNQKVDKLPEGVKIIKIWKKQKELFKNYKGEIEYWD